MSKLSLKAKDNLDFGRKREENLTRKFRMPAKMLESNLRRIDLLKVEPSNRIEIL